jgi:hypothetical protein
VVGVTQIQKNFISSARRLSRLSDLANSRRDAMAYGRCAALAELPALLSPTRAEEICFAEEALRLAASGLSQEQARVLWPALTGATRREGEALRAIPRNAAGTRSHRDRCFIAEPARPTAMLASPLLPHERRLPCRWLLDPF